MAILRNSPWQKPKIDLAGPQGNAWVLMGLASRFARELGLDAEAILAEMRSGDYEHLIQVFDRHFGAYVDLVRQS
jgi:hypothetical protein